MRAVFALWAVAVAVALSGGDGGQAAPPPQSAGGAAQSELAPAWLFLAESPQEAGASRVAPIDALVIAPSAELFLLPRVLVLWPATAPPPDERGVIRFQVLARVVRADGSVTEWPVGAAQGAPPGEGGRNLELAPAGTPTLVELGPARLGPVRTASVVAVEFVVSLLPSPPGPGLTAVGGLALEAAPAPGGADTPARDRAASVIRRAGGTPILAVRIPVVEQGAPVPGRERQRLAVAVGPEGFGPTAATELFTPTAEAPWALRGRDGARIAGVQALIVDLEVEIPDHAPPVQRGD
jgi:hypothetical protein